MTAGRGPRLAALLLAGLVLLLTGVVAAQAVTGHPGSHQALWLTGDER